MKTDQAIVSIFCACIYVYIYIYIYLKKITQARLFNYFQDNAAKIVLLTLSQADGCRM